MKIAMKKLKLFLPFLLSILIIMLIWFVIYIGYCFQAKKLMSEMALKHSIDRCYHVPTSKFRWAEKARKEYIFSGCSLEFYHTNFYSLVFFYDPDEKRVVDYSMINNFYQESIFDADYMKLCFIWRDSKEGLKLIYEQCEAILGDSRFFTKMIKTPVYSYEE